MGERNNVGGSSRGEGWTSFDLDVLAEPEEGEEINQANPPNAPEIMGPEEPSIDFLKERIKQVLRPLSSRATGSNVLTRIYEDLHLETAPPAKRFKINEVLEELSKRPLHSRQEVAIELTVTVNDWERSQGGIYNIS